MIEGLAIRNLRGIQSGEVGNLAALTVIVGPNGSGKSTILDALLIAASPDPSTAVGAAGSRRGTIGDAARWLFRRGAAGEPVELATWANAVERRVELRLGKVNGEIEVQGELRGHGQSTEGFATRFDYHNAFRGSGVVAIPRIVSEVVMLDPRHAREERTDAQLFTSVIERGARAALYETLPRLLDGAKELQILVDNGNQPALHLVFDGARGSIPLDLVSDGTASLLRMAMTLQTAADGLLLIEEPEIHLHPRTVRNVASMLARAAKAGPQIVLTTHSLELIDALTDACSDDLSLLTVVQTRLEEGKLRTASIPGESVASLRSQIDEDLR